MGTGIRTHCDWWLVLPVASSPPELLPTPHTSRFFSTTMLVAQPQNRISMSSGWKGQEAVTSVGVVTTAVEVVPLPHWPLSFLPHMYSFDLCTKDA